eukprot:NODE_13176_length_1180_cov_11.627730.p2 GENE.NODE_13176_length_1180_cov_11.627730~~NODE_13176_length_1180_cov_11.627730.p2  ORF type:complete len:273 (-),score=39.91 NODE_13176_length_1180_cov_11.627730:360-1097(-)
MLVPWSVAAQPALSLLGTLGSVRGFAIPRSPHPARKKKLPGPFGVEWFGGYRPSDIHAMYPELPKEPYNPRPYSVHFERYPGIASGLGAEYFYREGQNHPLTYYHMRSPRSGNVISVGATDPRATLARTIDNYVKERTRGFALQLVLEGRGVKAWWEPKHPHLMVRLGVGTKTTDLSEYCLRDPDIRVHVSKVGTTIVLHGPNKARVGTLAYRLLKRLQPRLMPYTGKGAHFAFHPPKRRAVRKK